MQGDKVPGGSAAAFTISGVTSGDVTFNVIDGELENGDTSFSVNLGEAVRVTLESGVSYDISVVSIGARAAAEVAAAAAGPLTPSRVLSINSQNGVAVVTFEVDGKTYSDKAAGRRHRDVMGRDRDHRRSTSTRQTVTIMHGDQTLTLHAGQVIVK